MWKDSEAEIDFLDYDYLVQSMNSIILDDSLLPASIGLYGDWGSGKSTLIRMSKFKLEVSNPKIKCLIFNGWLFESYDDAKTAILEEILDVFVREQSLEDKAKTIVKTLWDKLNKIKLAKLAIKLGLNFVNPETIAIDAVKKFAEKTKQDTTDSHDNLFDVQGFKEDLSKRLNYADLRNDLREFQKEFAQLLDLSKIDRLVVYIDELDRCRPDTILETLEAIKLFLFTGKTAFIIGADQRHIEYAVRTKFADIEGQEIDIGKEYLEKLIQYPILIPRLDTTEAQIYISCLLLQNELSPDTFAQVIDNLHCEQKINFENVDLEKILHSLSVDCGETLIVASQLATLLGQRLNGNPRQFKRFLNMLELRLSQAKFKNQTLKRSVLAKVMIVEYYRPALFKRMAQLLQNNELSKHIKVAENTFGGLENIPSDNVFYSNKEDIWLREWINMKPLLKDEDLRLYFYFSRTATEERLSLLSAPLSPNAREALRKLSTKVEKNLSQANDMVKNMPSSEQEQILIAFISQLAGQDDVDVKQLKAMIDIASLSNELHHVFLRHLQQLPGNLIKPKHIPYFIEYAENKNCAYEIIEIVKPLWDKKVLAIFEQRSSRKE